MTDKQERAITLALNVLHVGFFECPRHDYRNFLMEDDWALLILAAGGVHPVATDPDELALAVLTNAVERDGFFAHMTDFKPPAHYCSFLKEQVRRGERNMCLDPCKEGQQQCPYVTFENIKKSR